jgi:hypothetical protein
LTVRRFSSLRPQRFAGVPPVEHAVEAQFGDKVVLRGYKVLNNGDLLLFWERTDAGASSDLDLHFALETTTVDGTPIAQPADRRLAGYNYPFFRWSAGQIVMGHIPAQAWLGNDPQPGSVRFTLRVYDAQELGARPLPLPDGRDHLEVAPVEVIID